MPVEVEDRHHKQVVAVAGLPVGHEDLGGLQVPHGEHAVVLKTAADDRIATPVAVRGHWPEQRLVVLGHAASLPGIGDHVPEVSRGEIPVARNSGDYKRSVSDAPMALRPI